MLNQLKSRFERGWRIVYAACLGFWEDDCYTKASTLTFYTIQSIVPFLAAALAIAKGFGFDEYLEQVITSTFAEQKEVFDYAIKIALSMLQFISSGEIVGIGVILLLWTNINLVGYIELALNTIWRVRGARSLFQKIKDFSFAVVVFPLIFVASSSFTLYFKSQIHRLPYLATFDQFVLQYTKIALPWLLSCFLFGALYFLIPTAKIKVLPRLIASVIAGSAFQLWQVVFINLQVYIFSYNIVYGAFALIPLFLIWLQFSWMIALAGAELSAHIENYQWYLKDVSSSLFARVSPCELALLIAYECTETFYQNKVPHTVSSLSERLKVSQNVVSDVLGVLEENEILARINTRKHELCYHPLHDPAKIKLLAICKAMRSRQEDIIVETTPALQLIQAALSKIRHTSEASPDNVSLGALFQKEKECI